MILEIYVDGSCPGNPGPGGWGLLVAQEGSQEVLYEKFGAATNEKGEIDIVTNQIAEIMAMEQALGILVRRSFQGKSPATTIFVMDSAYVMNCFKDRWYINWRKYAVGGVWTTSKHEPVCNQWLWEKTVKSFEILERLGYKFLFQKVKSHITEKHPKWQPKYNPLNARVDELAKAGTQLAIEYLSTRVGHVEMWKGNINALGETNGIHHQ